MVNVAPPTVIVTVSGATASTAIRLNHNTGLVGIDPNGVLIEREVARAGFVLNQPTRRPDRGDILDTPRNCQGVLFTKEGLHLRVRNLTPGLFPFGQAPFGKEQQHHVTIVYLVVHHVGAGGALTQGHIDNGLLFYRLGSVCKGQPQARLHPCPLGRGVVLSHDARIARVDVLQGLGNIELNCLGEGFVSGVWLAIAHVISLHESGVKHDIPHGLFQVHLRPFVIMLDRFKGLSGK